MRAWKKGLAGMIVMIGCGLIFADTVSAKTKNIKIDLRGEMTPVERPIALEKAKKVRIVCSNKSVVAVRYKKDRKDKRIVFTGKKKGTAKVTVICTLKSRRKKTYKYRVQVIKSKEVTAKDKGKKAFKIQNQYRKEKGVAALEWSNELYEFCLYRIKTSGFDKHENLGRDGNAYFGKFYKYKHLMFGENLYCGSDRALDAMKAWKKSIRHYHNLLSEDHVCGAIAGYNGVWCAIFYDKEKGELKNWRDYQLKEITVRRYDSQKGIYLSGSSIGYYEAGKRQETLEAAKITETSGKKIYLEIGKTYVFYERISPDGCKKAESMTVTVTEDGESEIILKS